MAEFETVADELYGLAPDAFIPARDATAASLRAGGDPVTAKRVKQLRKPSVAAWALNHLVREDRVQVDELLALGDELRRAQRALSGAALRALTGQRQQVVRAVAQRAGALAEAEGHPLSPALVEQVARSLDAALTDPTSAAALLEGRLTTELTYAGLGETGPPEPHLTVVGDPDKPAAPKAAHTKAVRAAEKVVAEARADLAKATERVATANESADAAHLRVASAQDALAAVQTELEAAEDAEDAAESGLTLAEKQRAQAEDRLVVAEQRLIDLGLG